MRPSSQPIQIDNAVPAAVMWQKVSLKDACTLITDGTHYTPPNVGAGVPFLTVKDMNEAGLDFDGSSKISELEFERAATQNSAPSNGDVLFSKDGTVGKVHVVRNEQRFAVLSSIAILRPNKQILYPEYLAQFLRTPRSLSAATQRKTGSALTRIILKDIKQLEIPLPPLEEQKRIATILDQADKLRCLRQRAIDRLNDLGQAIFYEMFGDPTTNPVGWPIRKFEALARNEDGRRIPVKMADRENVEGEYPYYGASGIIDYVDDFIFEGQYLLIGEDGANLIAHSSPIAYMAEGRFWVNNHAHVLSDNNEADLRYLEFFIESIDLKKYVSGSAQPKLTQKNLNNIEVPSPPIDKQRDFASRIREIERAANDFRRSYKLFDQLFVSLQDRAFRGEL